MPDYEALEPQINKVAAVDSKVYELANKDEKNFGAAIRIRRQSLGLKAYELAYDVDVSPVYITQIEKHGKLPSPDIMERICNALQDDKLFKIYLRMKHPTMYKKLAEFEAGREANIDSEIEQMQREIEQMEVKRRNRTETETLKKLISDFETKVHKSEAKLHKSLGKLETIKKLHSNLKSNFEQRENSQD